MMPTHGTSSHSNPTLHRPPSPASTSATASAPCPVCNRRVPRAQLQQHANQCLDALPTERDEIPSPPPSPPPSQSPRDARHAKPASSTRGTPTAPTTVLSPPNNATAECQSAQKPAVSIFSWLSSLGLSKYTPGLLRADYRTLTDLCARPPTDTSLREQCGVAAMGARRKLLSALSALTPVSPVGAAGAKSQVQPGAKDTEQTDNQAVAEDDAEQKAKPKRKLWAIFEPGYRAAASSPPKRPRAAASRGTNTAGAQGDEASEWERRGDKRRESGRTESAKNVRHSFSQRVGGTSFTVDSFRAAASDPGCRVFFLTHFHSDHYGGLTKKRFPAGARVVCTAITKRLVQSQLRIPAEMIRELPVGKKVDFKDAGRGPQGGASVWAFDANHCPGAVLLLFHVWATSRYILHCGDCRFDRAVFDRHAKLAEVVSERKLDVLHLDTTYCDRRYTFPPQHAVLADVVRLARAEDARTRKRCLFFFGTYSIGKEKVFLAVADALDLHIYASKRKRGILDSLDLGPTYSSRVVDDPQQARVHVVSMFDLRPGMLSHYAHRNGLNTHFVGRGLAVLFRPTGWSFTGAGAGSGGPGTAPGASRAADQAVVYSVPYSEHSSFEELQQFVRWANPARLIPTVNARSKEAADGMRAALGHTDRPMRAIVNGSGR